MIFIGSTCCAISTFAANLSVDFEKPTGRPIINLTGEIIQSDGDNFSAIAHRYQNAIVNLNSNGGSLLAGIQIGTIIRLRAFSTLVRGSNVCASACAYAWLAGVQRYVENNSKIGFHAAYTLDHGIAKQSGVGNALLGSYLTKIALSDEAIVYFTSAQPEEMNWLNSSIAQKLQLSTQYYPQNNTPSKNNITNINEMKNLEIASQNFIRQLLSYWSADNSSATQFLQLALAEQVDFYGKSTPKENIIKEKTSALRRWPIRIYAERKSSVKTNCDYSLKKCTISGLLDWNASNPEKNKQSIGVASFEYTLDFSNITVKIIKETGSVIERR